MKRIVDPEQHKSKNSLYRVICKRCKFVYDLQQKDLVLRNMKGIPINSFRCVFCQQRNFFYKSASTEEIESVLKKRI